jgi:hypothetical protein
MKGGEVTKASIFARGSLKFSWAEVPLEEIEAASQSIERAREGLSKLATPEWKESIRVRKEGKT